MPCTTCGSTEHEWWGCPVYLGAVNRTSARNSLDTLVKLYPEFVDKWIRDQGYIKHSDEEISSLYKQLADLEPECDALRFRINQLVSERG